MLDLERQASDAAQARLPLISIVLPAYNEESVLVPSLRALWAFIQARRERYRWELVVVDDGSSDATGRLADAFAALRDNVTVLHHLENMGLGAALLTGFTAARGEYVATMDAGLSYAPEHLERMVDRIRETSAGIVLASARGRGVLSFAPRRAAATLTCVVRAYDTDRLRGLLQHTKSGDVNLELLVQAHRRGIRIEEMPADGEWTARSTRRSRARRIRRAMSLLRCAFMFGAPSPRPAPQAHRASHV